MEKRMAAELKAERAGAASAPPMRLVDNLSVLLVAPTQTCAATSLNAALQDVKAELLCDDAEGPPAPSRLEAAAHAASDADDDDVTVVEVAPAEVETIVLDSDSDSEAQPAAAAAADRGARRLKRRRAAVGTVTPMHVAPSRAPRKRARVEPAEPAASAAAAPSAAAAEVKVKVEKDGGWPEEFQELRRQPFNAGDCARLHGIFFTKRPLVAGSRESTTRSGRTRRVTERVVRDKVRPSRQPHALLIWKLLVHVIVFADCHASCPCSQASIEEWPRLSSQVESMDAAMQHEDALRHLRCLEFYLMRVNHPCLPRALRADGSTDGFAAGEMIDLISDDDDDDADKPEIIDVEALEALILGEGSTVPPPPLKQIKVERETSAADAAVPVALAKGGIDSGRRRQQVVFQLAYRRPLPSTKQQRQLPLQDKARAATSPL